MLGAKLQMNARIVIGLMFIAGGVFQWALGRHVQRTRHEGRVHSLWLRAPRLVRWWMLTVFPIAMQVVGLMTAALGAFWLIYFAIDLLR